VLGSITIRDLEDSERAWANAQYRAIRFAVTPPDAVALVAELAGQRVGLGRIVTHAPDVVELGGIWTDEAARGHGVARAMVSALLERLERTEREIEAERPGAAQGPGTTAPRGARRVWCIPFAHLAAFYQSFGFTVSAPPWPPSIAAKVADCIAQALPEVVVLAR
jgi:GNAT superfamily N-acetyltransferase